MCSGHVPSGLRVHPDREHLVYPLGCTVILKRLGDGGQHFLHGHTDNVSCVAVSKSGRYADIIIWDFAKRDIYARLSLHKAKVEALSFSPNDKYLVSLGGQDDGSYSLRVWELDLPNRKVRPTECQTSLLKRIITCIEIADDDQFFFCGTTSGDILKVNLKTRLLNICGPVKNKNKFQNMYRFSYTNLEDHQLISSSHSSAVLDAAIPFGSSELFATCSRDDIRVWHATTSKEVLRIRVPNMTCNALDIMVDGRSILSAWNDGKIRVFAPESGRILLVIDNAHSMGVTAVAWTRDCKKILSGGGEGQLRVWELQPAWGHRLLETMKEHKATVTDIQVKSDDKECVTASSDGACIIWDLVHYRRCQLVLANTLFRCVRYHPEELHIVTSGTDRKVCSWGGDDKLVKVWTYLEGEVTHVGVGHSGKITSVRLCSNNRTLVTTSSDGAILRWRFPHPPSSS
ncbi:hypothetical protein CRUP_018956 [Coryphaenoides rupestris]|nr:hypothetical protein CRUP_018956 [Coryphaenoides rupestris]